MATYNVSNAQELADALDAASGGDRIRLQSGDYGELNLSDMKFSSTLMISSVEPDDKASFSKLRLDNVDNIRFDNIKFDYDYSSGDGNAATRFTINDSKRVIIKDSEFEGDFASGTGTTADGTGFGRGLKITDSQSIDILDNEFHSWWKAVNIGTSKDVNFTGNNIHTIRSDGLSIGRSDNVLVENNYIHDFGGAAGSGDHRDMIQIKRSSEDGSRDITIRNNVFDIGEGDYTQTIFAGGDNANPNDPTDWHYNVTIENNVIYNAHTHGITFSMTEGLSISNNTLVAVPREKDSGVTIPRIHVGSESKDVTITNNITASISGDQGQSDWTVSNNVYIQRDDPSDSEYYGDVFVVHASTKSDGFNQFGIKEGSIADDANAGSSLADNYPFSYDAWVGTPSTDVNNGGDNGSGDNDSNTGSDDANTGSDDSNTGSDDANNGSDDSNADSTMVFDDFVLDIATLESNGQADLRDDAYIVDTNDGPAINFDGSNDRAKIGRLKDFEDSEQLGFQIEFAREEADGSAQRVVWNKGHVGLTVKNDGLIAYVADSDGNFAEFGIDNLGLNDTDTHEITVLIDQVADRLQVIVDDTLVLDETDTDFEFVEGSHGGRQWGWNLGTKSRDVEGQISHFAIDDDVQFVDADAQYGGDLII